MEENLVHLSLLSELVCYQASDEWDKSGHSEIKKKGLPKHANEAISL